ncbi:hypothetical protein [Bradyrhizobium sp. SZCCHNRI3043]|uniref:hypothetical protein n=1 Tax=Bradyrhizobium sp. SZCCHNRI3043 TaxID=3057292 RepID=UPI0028ECD2CD|nr:hypothetical protein [Bradyrhizobium sp. SZCCHNRI3043]
MAVVPQTAADLLRRAGQSDGVEFGRDLLFVDLPDEQRPCLSCNEIGLRRLPIGARRNGAFRQRLQYHRSFQELRAKINYFRKSANYVYAPFVPVRMRGVRVVTKRWAGNAVDVRASARFMRGRMMRLRT